MHTLSAEQFIEAVVSSAGREPLVVARAPGRVNLIGEHIDYCGGTVMPIATPHACYAAILDGDDGQALTLSTSLGEERATADLSTDLDPGRVQQGHWTSYVLGVVAGFQELTSVGSLAGKRIHVHSDVPLGAGLSSSAALEVSVATALAAYLGQAIEPLEIAKLCQRAEHDFAGVPCGLMDQAASAMCRAGHAMLLDCATFEVAHAPFDDTMRLVVVHSGVSHSLADGEYAKRRQTTEAAAARIGVEHLASAPPDAVDALPEDERPFARHVVSEQSRVMEAQSALERGDAVAFGAAMSASHDSLRDDYRVSCAEVDALVDAMRAVDGCLGARMTGGGFGGSVIALARPGAEQQIRAACDALKHMCPNLRHIDVEPWAGASTIR